MDKQREYQRLLQEAIYRVNNNEITTIEDLYTQLVVNLNKNIQPLQSEKEKVHY